MAKMRGRKSGLLYGLLAVPFAAILWIESYNRAEPSLFGIPFFYWYQLLWIPLGALALLPAYLAKRDGGAGR